MKISYSPKFKELLKELPYDVQQKLYKQAGFLKNDIRHPSLRSKKYGGREDLWQARVDRNVRFYFEIQNDTITLLSIKKHPK